MEDSPLFPNKKDRLVLRPILTVTEVWTTGEATGDIHIQDKWAIILITDDAFVFFKLNLLKMQKVNL